MADSGQLAAEFPFYFIIGMRVFFKKLHHAFAAKKAHVLGDGCAGKGDKLAYFEKRGLSVFDQVVEDNDAGGMSAGFVPEGEGIGGFVKEGGFGRGHGEGV